MRPYPMGQTRHIHDDSMFGSLTGRSSAIFLKNKYQSLIDDKLVEVWNHIHWMEGLVNVIDECDKSLKSRRAVIETLLKDINSTRDALSQHHNDQRTDDKESWKQTAEVLKEQAHTPVNIHSNRFGSFGASPTFVNAGGGRIPDRYQGGHMKRQEDRMFGTTRQLSERIAHEKKSYVASVKDYDTKVALFKPRCIKCEQDIARYKSLLEEGRQKIDGCRYIRGIFHSLSSEQNKVELGLDTTKHDVEKAEASLQTLKETMVKYDSAASSTEHRIYDIFER